MADVCDTRRGRLVADKQHVNGVVRSFSQWMQPTDAFISSFVEWVEWASGVRVQAMLYFIYTPLNAALRRAASPFHLQLGAAAYVTKPCSMQLAVQLRATQRTAWSVAHLQVVLGDQQDHLAVTDELFTGST